MSESGFQLPDGEDTVNLAKAKKALIDALGAQTASPLQSRYDLWHPGIQPPQFVGEGATPENGGPAAHAPADDGLLIGEDTRAAQLARSGHRADHTASTDTDPLVHGSGLPVHSSAPAPEAPAPSAPPLDLHVADQKAAHFTPLHDHMARAAALEAPEDAPQVGATLDTNIIAEDAAGHMVVGTLAPVNGAPDHSYTYEIVGGDGRFFIADGKIVLSPGACLDFETEPSLTLTVRVTDSYGNSYNSPVRIVVGDVNEAPHDISLTGNSVAENAPGGVIGRLSAIDPDAGDHLTYAVSDARFEVVNGQLKLKDGVSLNYEAEPGVTMHVTATDKGGLTTSRDITINVGDRNEAPEHLALTGNSVAENAAGAVIGTVSAIDTDAGDRLTYAVSDSRFEIVDGHLKLKAGLSLNFEAGPTVNLHLTTTDKAGLVTHHDVTVNVADVNEAPADLVLSNNTISENVPGGVIGQVSASDPDAGDHLTYSVSDSRFEVVDGSLKLKDGVSLDFETEPNVNLHLTATDKGGLTTSRDVTIHVGDANDAPIDLNFSHTGIAMNVDGGNNAYFHATDHGDVVGGLTAMTIEIQYSSAKVLNDWDYMDLFSYNVGGSGDEIEVALDNNANGIDFTIEIGNHYVELKGFDAYGLLDGGVHQLSMAWDSADGSLKVYADGKLAGSAMGIAKGHTITAGGEIVLGQEQDSRDGGYDATQNFQGAYHDVRIFDDVRTAQEIADNSMKDIDPKAPGLVVNWNMNELTGDKLVDVVNGKELNLGHVTGSGWSDSQPKHVAIISEYAGPDTVVTTMTASDPDANETFTYSIEKDPSGLFTIVGNEVRVKEGAVVDYSKAQSHDIVVKVTDDGGKSYTETLTVRVTNVNEAPNAPELNGNVVAENAAGAVIGKVTATDPDVVDKLRFLVSDSRFEVVNGNLKLKSGFSLDYETEPTVNIKITTVDAGGLKSETRDFTVTVTDKNDAPSPISLSASTVAENAAGAVIGQLNSIDQDAGDKISYTVSDSRFEIVNNELKLKSGISLNYETTKSVTVSVTATDLQGAKTTGGFKIGVSDVNEAPSVPTLSKTTIAENMAGGLIGNVSATDPDAGDKIIYSVSDSRFEVVGGQLKLKDGVFLDYEAEKTVALQITATDQGGLSSTRSVTIGVSNVNEAPTAPTLAGSPIAENMAGAIIGKVSATDPDAGDKLTYTVSDPRFEIVSGNLKLKTGISLDYEATPTVTVKLTATDSKGLSTSQEVTINVTDKNEAPSAPTLSNTTINENAPGGVVGTIATIDPEVNDQITYTLSDSRFEVVGGELKLKSGVALNYETEQQIALKVTATDKGGLAAVSNFTVKVVDVNEAPTAPTFTSTTNVDENTAGKVFGTVGGSIDPDAGDSIHYSVSDSRFEVVGNQLKLKDGVGLDYESNHQVTLDVTAIDSKGLGTSNTLTITVDDINEAPAALGIAGQHVETGHAFALNAGAAFADPDAGDHVTYSISGGPAWLSIDTQTGVISGSAPTGVSTPLLLTHGLTDLPQAEFLVLDTNVFSNTAGYTNSVGYYIADEAGNPIGGAIIETNAEQLGAHQTVIDLADYPNGAKLGFFILPDGYTKNAGLTDGTAVTFSEESGGWTVRYDGVALTAAEGKVFFSDTLLNADGFDHLTDTSAAGSMNWEETADDDDKDFNDVNMDGTLHAVGSVANDHHITVTATDSAGYVTSQQFDLGVTDRPWEVMNTGSPTAEADVINGGETADRIWAGGGDDEVNGWDGNDTLYGGDSNDALSGGIGDDALDGGSGNDTLHGNNGADALFGGSGDDTVYGDAGNDRLFGGDGNDNLYGGDGNDRLYGGAGNDILVGGDGDDTLYGGDGSDMFIFAAGDGKDVACGGAGAGWTDTIDVTGLHLTMATYGSEWTLSLTKGSVLSYDDHQATFSQDSDGIIALNDGTQIHFQHVERLIG